MITRVGCFPVFVADQDRALVFYRDQLGFQTVANHPLDAESRWVTVVPPGAETEICLYRPSGGSEEADALRRRIGSWTGVVLLTDDIRSTYQELSDRGVVFEAPPTQQPWGGWETWFRDPDGNRLHLVQRS